MAHATPLYRGAGYSTISSTQNKFPGVRARPSSISLLSQPADARSPSSVCSYAVRHVSANARGPTKPAHLSPQRAGDEKNPIKIFGGRFWSYSRVVRFYLQFNPRCTSRGFNYHSIFFHDTTWMLDVPRVGKRRKNPTKSSVVLSD